jgi:hypothetical protein
MDSFTGIQGFSPYLVQVWFGSCGQPQPAEKAIEKLY